MLEGPQESRKENMDHKRGTDIRELLEQHALDLDDDGINYVIEVLEDDDSLEDKDSLQEMLTPLLGSEKLAISIVEALSTDRIVDSAGSVPPTQKLEERSNMAVRSRLQDQPSASPQDRANSSVLDHAERTATAKNTRKTKSRRKTRQERQRKKNGKSIEQETAIEDDASAWQECKDEGHTWGGRGRGGRGEYSGAVNHVKANIHLSDVTVTLPTGADLLRNTVMDIQRGHRYGLIGRNGIGKSTVLRRLAQKSIPGLPPDMKILLVQQQVDGSEKDPLQTLVEADTDRSELLAEQDKLESMLDDPTQISESQLSEIAERLGAIAAELDALEADKAESRALVILKGLQFTSDMLGTPVNNLSGGWRMRLALAKALFVPSDLLLLDEATNHLDLYAVDWLIRYLSKDEERTMILVSHDRSFLDAVCSDIMYMSHERIKYHVGNFSEFERQQQEKSARDTQILDASERQRSKAEAFVQKQQSMANKRSADPNKQRQAKMIKEKKLDRIGNYREDGKRYKLMSMKKMGFEYARLAQKVEIQVDEVIIKMHFPAPNWPPGIAPGIPIVQLEDFSFGYTKDKQILKRTTLALHRGSKVALVGRNGSGKSTLVDLIAQKLRPKDYVSGGELSCKPIRVGHITQYSGEELERYASQTVAEYAEERFHNARAAKKMVSQASGNVRQYLGAFGLGGKHAMQLIGKLSGGERMRLCFATVLADEPHLLLLDESTNHVDYETLDSMSRALNEYTGSVLMISHNQSFLSGFCSELWVLEDGKVSVNHSDTESFDELFSDYRTVATGKSSGQLSAKRREQVTMAKKATKQQARAKQNTALL